MWGGCEAGGVRGGSAGQVRDIGPLRGVAELRAVCCAAVGSGCNYVGSARHIILFGFPFLDNGVRVALRTCGAMAAKDFPNEMSQLIL